ncbi:MAG: VapC toxin family PIN domain ribonuclease [Candidatus Riflebacteria bacterium HGW-Riflebacteria-1]|jgi:tRNA(fMet)-specific endonuclease VapC|nr:MAG: VapC toxin family PIN domain ribonuclease [Candidatus Riflebacteria bacterium HGW-Riflebacteria-1]
MSGKYLLDTNIVIALFQGEQPILDKIIQFKSVFTPSIVVGELYVRAFKSSKIKENVTRINEFALKNEILSCDQHTAKIYGEIKSGLKSIGKPIPENDIWIAATAMQYNLTLITRDSHFNDVSGLSFEMIEEA